MAVSNKGNLLFPKIRFLIDLLQFHPWVAILYDDVVENYDADENDEDLVNEQCPDNEQDLEDTEF